MGRVPGWRRVAIGIMAAAMAGAAFAEDFPSRPITLVVPYAAGGPADTIARLVAGRMGQTLGRQLVIENIAGAGGTIGAVRVAKAAPDGYTLLLHNLGLPAAPAFFKNLPYDTRNAFEPIGLINTGPMVLVSRKTLPPKTAQELWAYLRINAGAVTMAHAGTGANSHLCGLLLAQALGTKATFVPYKGSGPAMNDILAGQVDLLCDQSTTAVPQVEGGQVNAFAVTSDQRLDALPSIPTSSEAGLPSFKITIWHGLYAPAGAPAEIVKTLNDAVQQALGDAAIAERFKQVGTRPFDQPRRSPRAHRELLLAEIDRWSTLKDGP